MRKRLDLGPTPAMGRRRQAFPAARHRAARRSPSGAARVAPGPWASSSPWHLRASGAQAAAREPAAALPGETVPLPAWFAAS